MSWEKRRPHERRLPHIPLGDVRLFFIFILGHSARGVGDLYARHEMDAHLVEDAEKIREFMGEPHEQLRVAK